MSLKRHKVYVYGLQILSSCMTRMIICHVKMALIMYLSGVRNTKYGNQVLSWNCVNRGSSGGVTKKFFTRGRWAWARATRAQEALGHCSPSDTGFGLVLYGARGWDSTIHTGSFQLEMFPDSMFFACNSFLL